MTKYIPISIGFNCMTRYNIDILCNISEKYYPFDWCVTGDVKDIFELIKNDFENYYDLIDVKKKGDLNNPDYEKIKKINNIISGGYTNGVFALHKYYPSIIEYHYDLTIKEDKEKIDRRIERFKNIILDKSPILFIRIIVKKHNFDYNFFIKPFKKDVKYYNECIDNVRQSKKIDNFKILYIYVKYSKIKRKYLHINNDYLDAYKIYVPYDIRHYNDKKLQHHIKFIFNKYKFTNYSPLVG